MPIVYKAVQKIRDELLSLSGTEGFTFSYQEDVPTIPAIGKLFAFDTLANAKEFVSPSTQLGKVVEIWEAEAEDPEPSMPHLPLHPEYFRDFWWSPASFIKNQPQRCGWPPKGTLLCASITLKRRVA